MRAGIDNEIGWNRELFETLQARILLFMITLLLFVSGLEIILMCMIKDELGYFELTCFFRKILQKAYSKFERPITSFVSVDINRTLCTNTLFNNSKTSEKTAFVTKYPN